MGEKTNSLNIPLCESGKFKWSKSSSCIFDLLPRGGTNIEFDIFLEYLNFFLVILLLYE